MLPERLKAVVVWSAGVWVGRVAELDRCEARARTRDLCLDRLVDQARGLLGAQLVPLIVEEEPGALVGMSEAASMLGWDRRKFATYVARGHLPRPLAKLAGGRIWHRADIEAYASGLRMHGKQGGNGDK